MTDVTVVLQHYRLLR